MSINNQCWSSYIMRNIIYNIIQYTKKVSCTKLKQKIILSNQLFSKTQLLKKQTVFYTLFTFKLFTLYLNARGVNQVCPI